MSMTSDLDVIDSVTRTSQIIAAALIAGVVPILGVSVLVAPALGARPGAGGAVGAGPTDVGQILTWVAVAFAGAGLAMSVLIPRRITDQNRRSIAAGAWVPPAGANRRGWGAPSSIGPAAPESDPGKLAYVYMTQFIVGEALTEGPAFLACVAYMLGGHPIALGLALLLLGVLIARFPTRPRIGSWIERQQELLAQDRQAA